MSLLKHVKQHRRAPALTHTHVKVQIKILNGKLLKNTAVNAHVECHCQTPGVFLRGSRPVYENMKSSKMQSEIMYHIAFGRHKHCMGDQLDEPLIFSDFLNEIMHFPLNVILRNEMTIIVSLMLWLYS